MGIVLKHLFLYLGFKWMTTKTAAHNWEPACKEYEAMESSALNGTAATSIEVRDQIRQSIRAKGSGGQL